MRVFQCHTTAKKDVSETLLPHQEHFLGKALYPFSHPLPLTLFSVPPPATSLLPPPLLPCVTSLLLPPLACPGPAALSWGERLAAYSWKWTEILLRGHFVSCSGGEGRKP